MKHNHDGGQLPSLASPLCQPTVTSQAGAVLKMKLIDKPKWACKQWGNYEHDWMDCPDCVREYERSREGELLDQYLKGYEDAKKGKVVINPHGCQIRVMEWLAEQKYRRITHRHDDTWIAVDEAHAIYTHASTLPLLSDALMNWPEGAEVIPPSWRLNPQW